VGETRQDVAACVRLRRLPSQRYFNVARAGRSPVQNELQGKTRPVRIAYLVNSTMLCISSFRIRLRR